MNPNSQTSEQPLERVQFTSRAPTAVISNTATFKMGQFPRRLSQTYDTLSKRSTVLSFIRPHPGVWLEPADLENQSELAILQGRGSYDSTGLDIMLALLRQLKKFGYEAELEGTMTVEWDGFFEAASLDIGWKKTEDWLCKRALLEVLKHSVISKPLSFHDLWNRKELRCMFIDHAMFQISARRSVYAEGDERRIRDLSGDEWNCVPLLHETNALPADTFRKFFLLYKNQHGARYHRIGLKPKFLQVLHNVEGKGPSFKSLQYFEIDVPVRHMGSIGIQRAVFQLCAVVKLGSTEDIRTYSGDGSEVVPPVAGEGSMFLKEPASAQEKRWSVEEGGSYRLFYYRTFGEPYTAPQHHQEYEPRSWAATDDSSTPGRSDSPR